MNWKCSALVLFKLTRDLLPAWPPRSSVWLAALLPVTRHNYSRKSSECHVLRLLPVVKYFRTRCWDWGRMRKNAGLLVTTRLKGWASYQICRVKHWAAPTTSSCAHSQRRSGTMFEEKVMHSFSSRKGSSEHLALWKSSGQLKATLSLDLQLKKIASGEAKAACNWS